MKLLSKILLFFIIILFAFYFLLKTIGLSFIQKTIEQKAHISIKIFDISFWNGSVTARGIRLDPFLEIPKIYIQVSPLSLLKHKESPVTLFVLFPDSGKLHFQGNIKLTEKFSFNEFKGVLRAQNVSIVGLKDFLLHHYKIEPSSGTADLDSKILLKKTYLTSSHLLKIHNLSMNEKNLAGLASGVILRSIQGLDQKTIELKFQVNGDIAHPKFNWTEILGDAIAESFFENISQFKNPVKEIEDTTKGIIEDLKDLSPF